MDKQNENKSIEGIHGNKELTTLRDWAKHTGYDISDSDDFQQNNQFEYQEEYELDQRERGRDMQSYINQHTGK